MRYGTDEGHTVPSSTEEALFVVCHGHGRDYATVPLQDVTKTSGVMSNGEKVDVT